MDNRRDETDFSDHNTTAGVISQRAAMLAAVAWTVFVVYGSLLPFNYTAQPLALALEQFQHLRLIHIGPDGRADWMANLLLYVPLAFFWLAACDRPQSGPWRILGSSLVLTALCMLALIIEFGQIFFPPRTVSLNDLIAEWLGVSIGAAIWFAWGGYTRAIVLGFVRGGRGAVAPLMIAYAVAYVSLALFPFDFLLTPAEFSQKDPAQMGWWLAPRGCMRATQCAIQLAAEVALAMPLGIAFVLTRRVAPQRVAMMLVLFGVLIGAAIELAQLLLASGVSQGASVAAKTSGFVAGGLLAPYCVMGWSRLSKWRGLHAALALVGLAYVGVLALASGLMSGDALPWSEAIRRFDDIRLLPFYNYYYTSETRAVTSFLVQIALYVPPGILLALGARSWGDGGGAAAAGATSGILALAAQVGRLMHPPQRADPTDVLIAVAAGWGGYRITRFLIRLASGENAAAERVSSSGAYSRTLDGPATRWWVSALIAVGLAVFVVRFPVMRLELGLGLIAYCVLMFRYPKNWLVILLALLPTLDLAPWSGRYNFDEFDALVLASVAVGAVRLSDSNAISWPAWLAMLFGLFLLSVIVSIARGFVPWPSPSFLALAGYQSPLNALRVGRGLIWSCALLWLLVRTAPDPTDGQSRFALGMTLGLLGVGLIVLWERIVFTGLFNFRHEYRVAGTFSAISTAGAQIESYLAAATPFAMLIALRSRGWARLVGLAALGLMLYAVASTASRSAYAGVALAAGLMAVGWLWSAESMRRRLLVGLVVPAFALLIWMLVGGSYVTQRLADAGHDLAERKSHWALVLDLMDTNLATHVLGMGIGQYPPTFLWKAPTERRPGTFAFMRDGDDTIVRMGTGHAVYVDQFVPVAGGQRYTLRGRLRGQPNAEGILKLALCDKWILYGLDCVDTAITASSSGTWELFSRPVDAQGLGRGPPLFRRPVKLSLYNVGPTTIDVTDLKLEDARGRNILDNGDFARGGDRWYFSADDHFPWNIFNLFVEIFFEQGWLGLASFATLLGAVLLCLAIRVFHGNLGAAAFLSSLLGYLLPGLFDSVIDDPRMRLLLILLLCASVILTKRDARVTEPTTSH